MDTPSLRKKQLAKEKKKSRRDVYSSKHVRLQEMCMKTKQDTPEHKKKNGSKTSTK